MVYDSELLWDGMMHDSKKLWYGMLHDIELLCYGMLHDSDPDGAHLTLCSLNHNNTVA